MDEARPTMIDAWDRLVADRDRWRVRARWWRALYHRAGSDRDQLKTTVAGRFLIERDRLRQEVAEQHVFVDYYRGAWEREAEIAVGHATRLLWLRRLFFAANRDRRFAWEELKRENGLHVAARNERNELRAVIAEYQRAYHVLDHDIDSEDVDFIGPQFLAYKNAQAALLDMPTADPEEPT